MMKNGNAVSLAGGIMGLVSFALPWITYDGTRYTAYELIVDNHYFGMDSPPSFFLLWCLPLGAMILILASLLAPREELTAQHWNLAGAILGWVAIITVWVQAARTPASSESGPSLALSIGSWMATLAFLLALFGAISAWRQERREREYEESQRLREREAERARARESK